MKVKCAQCGTEILSQSAIDLHDHGEVEVYVKATGDKLGSRVPLFPKGRIHLCSERCLIHVLKTATATVRAEKLER